MPFDPCREWLGIDASDLKDPHRVLAIPPHETDGDTIVRLAEERLTRLSQIAPGPFAKAHAALLARVAEARDALLVTATWGSSSNAVTEPPALVPPPPSTLTSPALPTFTRPPSIMAGSPPSSTPLIPAAREMIPPLAPSVAFVDPAGTAAGQAVVTSAEPPSETLPFVPMAPVAHSSSPVRPSGVSTGAAGLGLLAVVLASALGVGYVASTRGLNLKLGGLQISVNPAVATIPAPPPPRATTEPSRPPSFADGAPTPEPPFPKPSKPPRETRSSQAAPSPKMPDETGPSQSPEPMAVPMPDPAVERRLAAERARIAKAVEASLSNAYHSLQRGDFDAADGAIKSVSGQVGDDVDLATRIERWRFVAACAREFTKYRDEAFQSANAGREYEVEGRRLVVIEVTPDTFVYRLQGQNVRTPRDRINPRIEMAVVETWFAADGRAANNIFLGARWLCIDPPNVTRARAAWQKAADGGENVSALLALLEDPIIRQAGGR
jgi:hypothetical protein